MAFLKVKNRAISSLASGVTNSATSWTLATGEGSKFPTTGDFNVTCEDEIVKCTARTSNVLTVVRAQEGTSAAAHIAGKAVKLQITAGVIENVQTELTTHAGLTTGVHGAGAGTVGILNKDTKIIDADADTGFEAEQSADEDILRGKVAGVEAFKVSAIGQLTLAKQSSVCAYKSAVDQKIPTGVNIKVVLDVEDYDIQNEMDSTTRTGVADATEANKLHDADGGFEAGDVGATVWNTTDNTYTTVSAFVDSGELTLVADIMADTEGYVLYQSRITIKETGIYVCTATCGWLGNTGRYITIIYVNGVSKIQGNQNISGTGLYPIVSCGAPIALTTNNYIELWCYQDSGNLGTLRKTIPQTQLRIAKIA